MQGVLVAVVPILIAGFALFMDRFESRILSGPVRGGQDGPHSDSAAGPGGTPVT